MATLKVILTKDIPNLGEEGEVKAVRRGYARNYLFPNNLVLDYSKKNRKILEQKKDYFEKKRLQKRENADQLKEKLEQQKISLSVPAGEKGRLYGTVTNNNIAQEFEKLGFTVDKRDIELKEHIKFAGNYKFRIHLYQDIYASQELEVIAIQEKKESATSKKRKKYNKPQPSASDQAVENSEQVVKNSDQAVENTDQAIEKTDQTVENADESVKAETSENSDSNDKTQE